MNPTPGVTPPLGESASIDPSHTERPEVLRAPRARTRGTMGISVYHAKDDPVTEDTPLYHETIAEFRRLGAPLPPPAPDPLAVAMRAWEAAVDAESVSHRRYVAACAARDEAYTIWQIDAAQQRIALETVQRIKAEREGHS